MLIQKNWTKNWQIPPLCTDKNWHLIKSCFPEFNVLKKNNKTDLADFSIRNMQPETPQKTQ